MGKWGGIVGWILWLSGEVWEGIDGWVMLFK